MIVVMTQVKERKKMCDVVTKINRVLWDLNASHLDQETYGLKAEMFGDGRVKVSDLVNAGYGDPAAVLKRLESLDPIDWRECDDWESPFIAIWDAIDLDPE